MKLNNPNTYAAVVGVLLFTLGLLGFAFKHTFKLADVYLIGSLVLGLWGILSVFKKQ